MFCGGEVSSRQIRGKAKTVTKGEDCVATSDARYARCTPFFYVPEALPHMINNTIPRLKPDFGKTEIEDKKYRKNEK